MYKIPFILFQSTRPYGTDPTIAVKSFVKMRGPYFGVCYILLLERMRLKL